MKQKRLKHVRCCNNIRIQSLDVDLLIEWKCIVEVSQGAVLGSIRLRELKQSEHKTIEGGKEKA